MTGRILRTRHTFPFLVAFVAYGLLAVAATFPLVLHLSTTVPHDPGDPMLSAAILWWNAHTVPFTTRWWNGFSFHPATGTIAFSDTRLGESLIATPLQWLGADPIVAYNLTLLATYPLSAIAAHWLGWVLTRRHDAAAVGALAFAFCPFRAAHIQHLELLGAFGMAVALGALHRFHETRTRSWLTLFAAALVLQGLSASYYALFFTVLLALWVWWFVGWHWRELLAIAVAAAVAMVMLAPLVVGYERIHDIYAFSRPFVEIVSLSADVTSLAAASPLLAVWGWTTSWIGGAPEREIFPGVTIVALLMFGAIRAWRAAVPARDPLDRVARWLLPVAAVFAAIAVCGWWFAPWRIAVPGLIISSEMPFKPLSLAIVTLVVAGALTSPMREARRRRSLLAFYAIAAAFLFVCSFGPKPMVAGRQVFYQPPYAWLMALPGFSSIRAPARFAMVAMLPLSMAGALAFARIATDGRRRRILSAVVVAGVLADGWMAPIPLAPLPDAWPPEGAASFAAVLELPLGDPFADLAAIYRATLHGRPVVNGNSGFDPTHYYTLRTALAEGDASVLDGLPSTERVLAVVDRKNDRDGSWSALVARTQRATPIANDDRWGFFALQPPPKPAPVCSGDAAAIVSARDDRGPIDIRPLTDRSPHTWWSTPMPQRVGDSMVLDLGHTMRPCAVLLAVGEFRISYPRALTIETSNDAAAWTTVASARTAPLTMRAALEDPIAVTLHIPIVPSDARFVRMRLTEAHPTIPWIITDVSVLAAHR